MGQDKRVGPRKSEFVGRQLLIDPILMTSCFHLKIEGYSEKRSANILPPILPIYNILVKVQLFVSSKAWSLRPQAFRCAVSIPINTNLVHTAVYINRSLTHHDRLLGGKPFRHVGPITVTEVGEPLTDPQLGPLYT